MTGTGEAVRLRVAIVAWRSRALLARCLESLFTHTNVQGMEVVVVDNASGDGTVEMVEERFPQVRLVCNDANLGFTQATNQGLAGSRAEAVLLLNPDTEILDDSIATSLEHLLSRPEVGILGCRIENPEGSFQPSALRYPNLRGLLMKALGLAQAFPRSPALNWDFYGDQDFPGPTEVECVMGGFFLIRGEVLDRVGPLDEHFFMYAEEADFARRVREAGYRVLFDPARSIRHISGGTSEQDAGTSAWAYAAKIRGALYFLLKWRGSGVAWLGAGIQVAGLLGRLPFWLLLDLRALPGRAGPQRFRRLRRFRHLAILFPALLWPRILARPWTR